MVVISLLLEAGADEKANDKAGFTALHTAAEWGRLETVRLLLNQGADPEAKTKDRETPLISACAMSGTEDVVAALLHASSKTKDKFVAWEVGLTGIYSPICVPNRIISNVPNY